MTEIIMPFDLLASTLKRAGYDVDVKDECPNNQGVYRFGQVSGKGIKAGFCEHNGESYWYIDGRFAADHVDCFNKWSGCPLCVELPTTQEEADKIVEHLKFLGSQEGHDWSASYAYFDDPKLPCVSPGDERA